MKIISWIAERNPHKGKDLFHTGFDNYPCLFLCVVCDVPFSALDRKLFQLLVIYIEEFSVKHKKISLCKRKELSFLWLNVVSPGVWGGEELRSLWCL